MRNVYWRCHHILEGQIQCEHQIHQLQQLLKKKPHSKIGLYAISIERVKHGPASEAKEMENLKENEVFLSDLPNEKNGDQLVFEQKVFWANESFKRVHQSIINWFLSLPESRIYPKTAANNKNGFCAKCKSYVYDEGKFFLYKKVWCTDGIG